MNDSGTGVDQRHIEVIVWSDRNVRSEVIDVAAVTSVILKCSFNVDCLSLEILNPQYLAMC